MLPNLRSDGCIFRFIPAIMHECLGALSADPEGPSRFLIFCNGSMSGRVCLGELRLTRFPWISIPLARGRGTNHIIIFKYQDTHVYTYITYRYAWGTFDVRSYVSCSWYTSSIHQIRHFTANKNRCKRKERIKEHEQPKIT